MNVRYKLTSDAKKIKMENGDVVSIPTSSLPIFVDLLEPTEEGSCIGVKVKLFFSDGTIMTGKILGCYITLHDKDLLYDGRFNSNQ